MASLAIPIRQSSHKNLPHGANAADRGRSGAGLGETLDAAPHAGLGPGPFSHRTIS